jgi:hypothetical protein
MIQFPYQRDERLAPRSVDDLTRASVASLGRVPVSRLRSAKPYRQNKTGTRYRFFSVLRACCQSPPGFKRRNLSGCLVAYVPQLPDVPGAVYAWLGVYWCGSVAFRSS